MADQLPLFSEPDPGSPAPDTATALHRRLDSLRQVASALPAALYMGTSSWTFPGWAGLVYPRKTATAELAREGLREYARHPLLRTVGIDRGYYAPIPEQDLCSFGEQLPPGFPCCAKAPAAVTSLVTPDGGVNTEFLSCERFWADMLEPFDRVFRDHAGPFIFQFSRLSHRNALDASEFAERLDRFLSGLPRHLRYSVELRDAGFMSPGYAGVLARHGAAHVYNYWSAMPRPAAQAKMLPPETLPFTMVRLLMPPGTRYDSQFARFSPFDRLVAPDPALRQEVASIVRRSTAGHRHCYVLVNNKAEGSAPLTIEALARIIAEPDAGRANPPDA
jgi:uncharacterized protein YecE (DUF72 family)